MSAYFILLMDQPVHPERLAEYRRLGFAAFEGSGGRFVVRPGGAFDCVEGATTASAVVVEFDTMQQARDFYFSPQYQEALAIRLGAVSSHAVLIEGAPPN